MKKTIQKRIKDFAKGTRTVLQLGNYSAEDIDSLLEIFEPIVEGVRYHPDNIPSLAMRISSELERMYEDLEAGTPCESHVEEILSEVSSLERDIVKYVAGKDCKVDFTEQEYALVREALCSSSREQKTRCFESILKPDGYCSKWDFCECAIKLDSPVRIFDEVYEENLYVGSVRYHQSENWDSDRELFTFEVFLGYKHDNDDLYYDEAELTEFSDESLDLLLKAISLKGLSREVRFFRAD